MVNNQMKLVGEVIRDVELKVATCNNNPPTLSGIDYTQSSSYNPNDTIYESNVCASILASFRIHGFDADTIGSKSVFNISWNQNISNASFTVSNGNTNHAYADFSWTPGLANIGKTYAFTATIRDSACPYNSIKHFTYRLHVVDPIAINLSNISMCINHITTLQGPPADSYLWSTGDTSQSIQVSGTQLGVGTHTLWLKATLGNCSDTDSLEVQVAPCTYIQENAKTKITLAPNPNSGQFILKITPLFSSDFTLNLYSIDGRLVKQMHVSGNNRGEFDIDLGAISQGVYIIKILDGESLLHQEKIIIQ
jgi:hypothetical protein